MAEKTLENSSEKSFSLAYKLDREALAEDMYVLTSAFLDGDSNVPVKLEIKQFLDKENTLYVAIALESIKIDEFNTQGNTENGVTNQYAHSSTTSIVNLFKKINPSDKSFFKFSENKKDTLPSGKIVSTFSGSKANNVSSANSILDSAEKAIVSLKILRKNLPRRAFPSRTSSTERRWLRRSTGWLVPTRSARQ